jgi:type I restriction enzyme S subunit
VISSRAPIGYVAIPTVPFCTNQGCKTIKLKSAFDSIFAYYNVLFNIGKIKNLGEGTTFAEISKAGLSTVELAFPKSYSEQTKIAEILSIVDRALEQTKALIAKQQSIKTGLMQALLTRGIDEHGNLRSEETHAFKDSPLGRIPVEWEVEHFERQIESSAFGPRFPATAYSKSGNIAMLRTTDLDAFGNIAYEQMPCASLDTKAFEAHFLKQGDLLITRSGTIGIPAVFDEFDVPVIPGHF